MASSDGERSSAPFTSTPVCHVLQPVLGPIGDKPSGLYFRASGDVCTDPLDRSAFRLGADSCIEFDTYFGAFFEKPWRAQVGDFRLWLALEASVNLRLQLWRRVDSSSKLVWETTTKEDGPVAVEIPQVAEPGRLYLTAFTARSPATLQTIRWLTDNAPRETQLVIGFCAFSYREHALRSAGLLVEELARGDSSTRVIVVDQSDSDEQVVPETSFEIVRQPNLGGSGGFARIMMEALNTPGATHVILFDDDTDLDPQVVSRVRALCALLPVDKIIAGQMLDMSMPHMLRETGATLDRQRLRIAPNCSGIDLIVNLDEVREPVRTDYGAWFACIVPIAAIQRGGLPMPFFINFDDVEFGLRLSGTSIPTVTFPGIAVWHLPGTAKDDDWRTFFYHRNIAIIASVHGITNIHGVARNFVRRAVKAIVAGNFFKARLACDGIGEFLRGPGPMPSGPAPVLDRIAKRRKAQPVHWQWRSLAAIPGLCLRVLAQTFLLMLLGNMAMTRWRDKASSLITEAAWRRTIAQADGQKT